MSFTVTEWFIKEFSNTVYHTAQQSQSRLAGHARQESQSSKMQGFDRIGATDPVEMVNRHGDTPQIDTPHSRRNVILRDYNWADLIDNMDKVRTLNDPTNPYIVSAKKGFIRRKDHVYYQAAIGKALAGEDGLTEIALPTDQKIAAVKAGALSSLNIDTLRLISEKFTIAEVLDEEDPIIYMTLDGKSKTALLTNTEITSADYNTVRSLVNGTIDTFMGIKFIPYQRSEVEADVVNYNLATGEYDAAGTSAAGSLKLMAWVESGMISSMGQDIKTRLSERPDKNYSMQAYIDMSVGAVRMEEVKVIQVTVTN